LRYDPIKEDFLLNKHLFVEYRNLSRNRNLLPENLAKLHKNLVKLNFILSLDSMIFKEEDVKGMYTMRIVSVFNLFIRDKMMRILENDQLSNYGGYGFIISVDELKREFNTIDQNLAYLSQGLKSNRIYH